MLATNRRVKKEFFPKIMAEGQFLPSQSFYLRFLDRKDVQPSQFSFIVPVKVKKTSVGRHLIKRKMSAVAENALNQVKPGFSCLLFAKKDVSKVPYLQIEVEILDLLGKISYTH